MDKLLKLLAIESSGIFGTIILSSIILLLILVTLLVRKQKDTLCYFYRLLISPYYWFIHEIFKYRKSEKKSIEFNSKKYLFDRLVVVVVLLLFMFGFFIFSNGISSGWKKMIPPDHLVKKSKKAQQELQITQRNYSQLKKQVANFNSEWRKNNNKWFNAHQKELKSSVESISVSFTELTDQYLSNSEFVNEINRIKSHYSSIEITDDPQILKARIDLTIQRSYSLPDTIKSELQAANELLANLTSAKRNLLKLNKSDIRKLHQPEYAQTLSSLSQTESTLKSNKTSYSFAKKEAHWKIENLAIGLLLGVLSAFNYYWLTGLALGVVFYLFDFTTIIIGFVLELFYFLRSFFAHKRHRLDMPANNEVETN